VDTTFSNSEAYISKLSYDHSPFKFSTYLGGEDNHEGRNFDIDASGKSFNKQRRVPKSGDFSSGQGAEK